MPTATAAATLVNITERIAADALEHQKLPGIQIAGADAAAGYALAPNATELTPSPPMDESGAGAAGGIVSTAGDLIAWDEALLAGRIIAPADAALMRSSGQLTNGTPTGYGFGWIIDSTGGHRRIWHNGGTFGFHAVNATFPDDAETIVVLTNRADGGAESIAAKTFAGLHPDVAAVQSVAAPGELPDVTGKVREWLARFEHGNPDRSQLAPVMDAALTADVANAAKAQFASLGDPQSLIYRGKVDGPNATIYQYAATFAQGSFVITMVLDGSGKISGYWLRPG